MVEFVRDLQVRAAMASLMKSVWKLGSLMRTVAILMMLRRVVLEDLLWVEASYR